MLLTEEFLTSIGFTKMPANMLVPSAFPNISIKEQWSYKSILFIKQMSEGVEYYVFCDKDNVDFTLAIENEVDLRDILILVDQGNSFADIWGMIQDKRKVIVERLQKYPGGKPYLEDFRLNELGGSHFLLVSNPDQKVHRIYQQFSNQAFVYTFNDINLLENSTNSVHTGHYSHSSIGFWYLAIESYINSLIKLCCLKKNIDFKTKYKNQDLHTRISSLVDLLGVDKVQFHQTKIIAKVQEFSQFRNELFHDR